MSANYSYLKPKIAAHMEDAKLWLLQSGAKAAIHWTEAQGIALHNEEGRLIAGWQEIALETRARFISKQ